MTKAKYIPEVARGHSGNICPKKRIVCDMVEMCRLLWCAASPPPGPGRPHFRPLGEEILTVEEKYTLHMKQQRSRGATG